MNLVDKAPLEEVLDFLEQYDFRASFPRTGQLLVSLLQTIGGLCDRLESAEETIQTGAGPDREQDQDLILAVRSRVREVLQEDADASE